jgi:hypothetical protein
MCVVAALRREESVLVVAETNAAVDNIARRLRSCFDTAVLRLGCVSVISRDLFDLTLEGQVQLSACVHNKRAFHTDKSTGHRSINKELAVKIIKSAKVVCTTCTGAGDQWLALRMKDCERGFDLVVMDEATLSPEPESLISLACGATKVVLIGDPCQLGPFDVGNYESCQRESKSGWSTFLKEDPADSTTSHQHGHQKDWSFPCPNRSSLSITLFHRLQQTLHVEFLDRQHRMNPALARFPSSEFYGGRLLDGVSADDRQPPDFIWPDPCRPLCFIDVDTPERHAGTSFINDGQAAAACDVVKGLLQDTSFSAANVCILVAYAAQVQVVEGKSDGLCPNVYTIDDFQGREAEVVVVSTVRTSALGFLADAKRINVLLTRARAALVVIGCRQCLECSDVWASWLLQAPRLGHDTVQAYLSRVKKSSEKGPRGDAGLARSRGGTGLASARGGAGQARTRDSAGQAGSAVLSGVRYGAGLAATKGGERLAGARGGSRLAGARRGALSAGQSK